MNTKRSSNHTPEQAAWGLFYARLHALAEQIRQGQTKPEQQANEAKNRRGEK